MFVCLLFLILIINIYYKNKNKCDFPYRFTNISETSETHNQNAYKKNIYTYLKKIWFKPKKTWFKSKKPAFLVFSFKTRFFSNPEENKFWKN